jgi:serine/threonine-protein kinase RsbW
MIRAFLRDFCDRDNGLKLSKNQRYLLELAVTEVASNITRHSYHGQEEMPIWVRIYRDSDYIRIRISHTGDSYEGPKKIQAPTLDTSREGGFGLYIVSRIVDDISYGKDENGRQYIELSKRLNP